ncbi:hypothetical protein Syun_024726 [Stephania yunnanensis]|uniref:Cytochrome P450 n=1 Tax=Stephania yunnanensis TaxID=152371 RepID=A0AAP0HV35_9MAGN
MAIRNSIFFITLCSSLLLFYSNAQSPSILLSLFLPLLVLFIFKHWSYSNTSNLPPGPISIPIFGNWLQVGDDLNHRFLASMSQTYGSIFHLKLGSRDLVVVSDPELASEVLHGQGVEFGSRPRNVVSMYSPAMDRTCNMWEEEMKLVVQDLMKLRAEGVVIRKRLQLMLYNIMYRMMFDCKFESQEDPLFVQATKFNSERSRLAQSFEYNYGDFIPFLRPFLRGYLNKCRDLQSRRLAFFNNYFIQKRRKVMEGNGDGHKMTCAIDHIIEAQRKGEISEENVLYIVENINVAAIETTLWSMEWAIAELVNHPHVQHKIRDEISTVLQADSLTESNLYKLPYLQATIKETLRLHSPIPLLVPHMNLEEAKLGGYTIPKGSKVVVNAWWLSNNPEWWKNPTEFRPERFLEEEGGTEAVAGGKVDFRFLPFGVGRRSCPGIILALPILGLVVGKLVSKFELKAPHGVEKIDVSEKGGQFSLHIANHSTVIFVPLSP